MLSVIVPVYNAEKTLGRCLDSILLQTYRELEVIVVDDGSTDGSGALAEDYARRDGRVRVIHRENGGLSRARNDGLDAARGAYVAFVDSDDWVEPDIYRAAMDYSADICCFGGSKDRPGSAGIWQPCRQPETIDSASALYRLLVTNRLGHGVWDKLYKRELFDKLRFPEDCCFEEVRLTWRLLEEAKTVALIPDVGYHYVQYGDGLFHSPLVRIRLDHWTAYYEILCTFSSRGEEYRLAALRRCAWAIYTDFSSLAGADSAFRRKESARIGEMIAFCRENKSELLSLPGLKSYVRLAVRLVAALGERARLPLHLLFRLQRSLRREKVYPRKG